MARFVLPNIVAQRIRRQHRLRPRRHHSDLPLRSAEKSSCDEVMGDSTWTSAVRDFFSSVWLWLLGEKEEETFRQGLERKYPKIGSDLHPKRREDAAATHDDVEVLSTRGHYDRRRVNDLL